MKLQRTVFFQRIIPAFTGAGLALAMVTSVASAAGYGDDDPGQAACMAIDCADGSRQCATVSGSAVYNIWWPTFPFFVPMTFPFTKTCYEKPAE